MPPENNADRTCPTIESQLGDVINQIVNYEAQKLPELKTELEQVKKKKEDAEREYGAKYEELKKRWCDQNELVLAIWRGLKCAYPEWDKSIRDCVCKELGKARNEDLRVKCREEIKGRFEAARDRARAHHDCAKDAAAAWTGAVKIITDQLNANGKLIDEIGKLAGTADRHAAIYRLWFKLLLAHARIRPETECFNIPATEHPENLCPPPKFEPCRKCDQYEPAPTADSNCPVPTLPADPDPITKWPQGKPWLIDPAKIGTTIDCAYKDYLDAKKALGEAQRCFVANPDDLATVRANRDALWKGVDVAIEKCLKDSAGKGCCEKEEDAKPKDDADCKDTRNIQKQGA